MIKFEFWYIVETVANILILFILLRIFLFKPINKMRDERTRTIQDNLDSAEKAKTEAEELRQQYEDSISEAKEKANEEVNKAAQKANDEVNKAADKLLKGAGLK